MINKRCDFRTVGKLKTIGRFAILGSALALGVAGCATIEGGPNASAKAVDIESLLPAGYGLSGEFQNCLPNTRSASFSHIGEKLMLVRVGNDRYLNRTTGDCSDGDRAGSRLQYTVRGGQFCSGQIIQVVDNTSGIFAGSCSLNKFEKLVRLPDEAEAEDGMDAPDGN